MAVMLIFLYFRCVVTWNLLFSSQGHAVPNKTKILNKMICLEQLQINVFTFRSYCRHTHTHTESIFPATCKRRQAGGWEKSCCINVAGGSDRLWQPSQGLNNIPNCVPDPRSSTGFCLAPGITLYQKDTAEYTLSMI